MSLSIIAEKAGPITSHAPPHRMTPGAMLMETSAFDVSITATHSFDNAPKLDILLVPGGLGNRALVQNNNTKLEEFVARRFEETEYVLSVCTGSALLARAGVLDGRRATSNKAAWAFPIQFGKNVTWVPSARWVRDGKVWTSSGVAAGMDMTYAFLRHIFGDPKVNNSLNLAEYAPHVDPNWDPFSVVHKVRALIILATLLPHADSRARAGRYYRSLVLTRRDRWLIASVRHSRMTVPKLGCSEAALRESRRSRTRESGLCMP